MIEVAGIIIYRNKAYVPANAKVDGGPYVAVDPVFITDVTVDGLTQALEDVIARGHPQIGPLTAEDWRKRKDPVLRAAGVPSWSKLAKDGGKSYGIVWNQDTITLYLHALDEKGRFASGLGRHQTFPRDVPVHAIARTIVADIAQHQLP